MSPQVERVVSAIRSIDRRHDEQVTGEVDSTASWRWRSDDTLDVRMRLSALDGATFLAAVVRAEYERKRTEGDLDIGDLDIPDAALQEGADERSEDEAAVGEVAGRGPSDRRLWRPASC